MLSNRLSHPRSKRPATGARRQRWRLQPTLLALEARALLSTFQVTNNAVDDVNTTGTLRWAIAQANAATSPSDIEFELGSTPATITLSQGQLDLSNTSDATTIYDGPGEGAVTVSGNNASRVLQVDANVTASISGLTITGGNSGKYSNGGGLANFGTTTLDGCTVSDNTALYFSYGGGVYNGGTLAMVNCTVSGNSVSGVGAGVSSGTFDNYAPTLTMTNCTVSANSGYYGLFATGAAALTNTIVAGNMGTDINAPSASGTNNLIGTGVAGGLVNGADGNLVGVTNPLLAPLANYGGPTQTMALLPGSAAIGAGTSTGAPTTDQRGLTRVGAVDIGAFQSSGFTIAVTSGSGQSASGAFPDPLVATVTANNLIEPVAGGLVTFTPPDSGPSATISGSPAVIDADGAASVTAASNLIGGTYTVLATANGAPLAASFTLTNYAIVSIAVSPGNPTLAVGVSGQFTAVGTFTDGSTQNLTNTVAWASGTPSAATISGTGVATALTPGTTAITAGEAGVTSPDDTLTVIAPNYVVNTTADAFGFYSGTTSLREAIAGANAVPGQTITFDNTVFKTSQTIDLTGGQLELSDTTGTETITGPKAGVTIDAGGNSRVFQVDPSVTASISGLTITGGNVTGDISAVGGGLLNYGATTLTNCTVSGNSTSSTSAFINTSFNGGGGIFNAGTLSLTNCTVSNNAASATAGFNFGGGGGISNASTLGGGNPTMSLTNCTISGNSVNRGSGGGISNFADAATLTNCTVSGNSAPDAGGGGLYNIRGKLTLTNCNVSGNSAGHGGGVLTSAENIGGISSFSSFPGTTTLNNCIVSSNTAIGSGGGLATSASTTTLNNSSVSGNSAANGGGLYSAGVFFGGNRYGTTNLTNCTVSGNSASGNGGGLDNGSFDTTTLTNCTVSGNSAVAGGGIANQGTLNVSYSTFRSNRAIGGAGGAGIGGGILSNGGSVVLGRCSLFSNEAIGGAGAIGVAGGDGIGGGLALENNPTATVTSTVFLFNVAQGGAGGAGANGGAGEGGGIAVAIGGTSDTTSVILNADMVALGVAQGGKGGSGANGGAGSGGGIFVGAAGSASLFQSGVVNNLAQGGAGGAGANGGAGSGGGIFVGAAGSASLDQTDLLLNQALGGLGYGGGANGDGIGGGLYVTSGGVVTLRKSTVTENFASFSNGNIYGNVTYE